MAKILEINCETGESIEREMTPSELEAQQKMQEDLETQRLASEAESARISQIKASAKSKLIAGQPLTAEEADTLII